MAKVQMTTWWL